MENIDPPRHYPDRRHPTLIFGGGGIPVSVNRVSPVLSERQFNWFGVINRHVRDVFVRLAHLAAKCDEGLETQLIFLHYESVDRSRLHGKHTKFSLPKVYDSSPALFPQGGEKKNTVSIFTLPYLPPVFGYFSSTTGELFS